MSRYLLGCVALAYAWTAIEYWAMGRPGMGLMFVAYAVANIGLMMEG